MDFSMSSRVRENVYEPDGTVLITDMIPLTLPIIINLDDSYLLVDSLQMDLALISRLKPFLCAEIGCGSGFVICHLAKLFGGSDDPSNNPILPIATDINRFAIECTREMSVRNGVDLPVLVKTRFLTGFRTNLLFDLIVFNPPYVESEEAEVTESHNDSIVKSYAGGCKGRMVIDEFLAIFPVSLDREYGINAHNFHLNMELTHTLFICRSI